MPLYSSSTVISRCFFSFSCLRDNDRGFIDAGELGLTLPERRLPWDREGQRSLVRGVQRQVPNRLRENPTGDRRTIAAKSSCGARERLHRIAAGTLPPEY